MDEANSSISHRKNYLAMINRAFDEKFKSMNEYKHEANFKRCLSKLQLTNVINAVNRAKSIMLINQKNGYTLHQYKGYKFYKENPSLSLWEIIDRILKDCALI